MSAKTRRQQIEEMLADEPNDPFLRYGLAMEHISQGDDDAAVRCFRDLFTVAPDYVPAYMQAGQLLARLGQADDARTIFRQGIDAARKQNNEHAAEEMTGMLGNLGSFEL